jgi:hypothetical protein
MRYRTTAWPMALLLLAGVSHAADSSYPSVTFNGYGTLGVVHSDEEEADFVTSFIQPNGAGYTHDWAFGVDSRVGLQMTANFSEKLSAVVQLVSEHRYDNSYTPTVEWANIKYDFTPDFSLRVGRIVLPGLIVSDYRKVGFAIPWVRPPVEVYSLVPITNSDGMDASYSFRRGEITNTLHALIGQKDIDTPASGTWKARDTVGIFDTVEFGNTLLRAGYLKSDVNSATINSLMDLFRQFGPSGTAIANTYDIEDKPIDLWVLGGRYDADAWFVMAEWVRSESDSFLRTDTAWYVSGGYRLGQFTPYATVAQKNNVDSGSHPALDTTFLPPMLQGFASVLNAELDNLLLPDESTALSLGTRWDFRDSFNLKLQFDHIILNENSRGALTKIQPGFRRGDEVNIVSATIDFVF